MKLLHWKIIAGLVLVFGAGMVVGAVSTGVMIHRAFARSMQFDHWTAKSTEIIAKKLHLTPEQRVQAQVIVEATNQKLRSTFTAAINESGQTIMASSREMDKLLTPEQQAANREFLANFFRPWKKLGLTPPEPLGNGPAAERRFVAFAGRDLSASDRERVELVRCAVPEAWRGFQHSFEAAATGLGFVRGVELFHQFQKTGLEFCYAQVLRRDVDVEESAKFPRFVANDAAFPFEPGVKWRAGESGQESNLHFVQTGIANEMQDIVEHLRRVSVQSKNEAAVDGDAVRLNLRDRGFVRIALPRFPVVVQFESFEPGTARTFESN